MKRTISLLLALLLLLGMLSACSSTPAAPSDPVNTAGDTSAAEPKIPAEEPVSPGEAPSAEPAPAENFDSVGVELPKGLAEGSVFPICAPGEITLEYWRSANDDTLKRGDNPFADNYAWRAIEEATGIHVEFNLFSGANYATQYSLMLVSEDYPDVAESPIGGGYSGGNDKAIEDGVYVDLAEYKDLMPNYMRWVNLSKGNTKTAYTDEGHMVFFNQAYDHSQATYLGYTIRRDWLDDLGLEIPTTLDQWYDVLLAFKENKTGGAAPLDMGFSGSKGFSTSTYIDGAFNVNGSADCGLIVKGTTIESSFRSQGLYDYLELMRKWYDEGLVDPDFMAPTFFWNMERLANNEIGFIPAMYTQVGTFCADAGMAEQGCYMELMPVPTLDGTERHIYSKGVWASGMGMPGGAVIFADSDIVEEAIRWCDYRYSEPGYMTTNYGVLGETYDFDENGQPYLFDLLVNNPDGLSAGFAQEVYLIHNGSVVFLLDREESQASEEGIRYNELWNNVGDWTLSGSLTYTAEEGEERSALITDLTTYITEYVCKVITGQTELNEGTWSEFQDQLTTMGLDRVVEITQEAYNRFLAR